MSDRSRAKAGFTLVELMMVVALVGVISAIAIPNFMTYQARSRRSEAYVNIVSIARAQKAYYAEKDTYHDSEAPWPNWVLNGGLGTQKQIWDDESLSHFAELGWKPEGPTIYSYEANTDPATCDGCVLCFTATAYGDADGDGFPSAVMYVNPHDEGGAQRECKAKLFDFGTPTRPTGAPVYNEVEVNRQTDEF